MSTHSITHKKKTLDANSPQYEQHSKQSYKHRTIVGLIVGAIIGFIGSFTIGTYNKEILAFLKNIDNYLPYLQYYILPVILVLFTIYSIVYTAYAIKKGKRQIASWDGEDNEHIDIADRLLNNALKCSSNHLIINCVIYAIITYNLFQGFEHHFQNISGRYKCIIIFTIVIVYFFNLYFTGAQQNRIIKLVQQYAPEKKGSVYDKKFKEVWLESCDEAERALIYKASYNTMQFMQRILSGIFFTTTLIGMFFPIGILCCIIVGALWMVMSIYYQKEETKLGCK